MSRRLKVLVSAYACSPYKGSEPGVGWGFVFELAKHHDLWVIVEEDEFKGDIERYLYEHPEFRQKIRFFFLRRYHHPSLRKIWPPSYYWYYRRWHWEAYQLAQRLHRQFNFDLVHQLNMVGFREPGYLWELGVPFIWGPVGGMGLFPWRFFTKIGLYGVLYFLGYNLYNSVHMRFLQRPRKAAKAAGNGLIAMNKENQTGLYHYYGVSSQVCVPVGPPQKAAEKIGRRLANEPFRIVWVGLQIPGKALNLALEALSLFSLDIAWKLEVLGGGPLMKKSEEYAIKLGLEKCCIFRGQVPRDQVLNVMSRSHVHLLTSLREGTPTVILEAFSFALPTICLDCSGMRDIVNNACGIKIPVTTPAEVVKGIASAVERLAENEDLRQRLAEGALTRARDFSWERKAEIVNRIYADRIREAEVDFRDVK